MKTFSINEKEHFLRHFDFPPDATPHQKHLSDIENQVKISVGVGENI